MKHKFYVFFTFFLLGYSFTVPAQKQVEQPWYGIGFEVTTKYSKMIKHTSKFTGPLSDFCYGADVNILFQTYGRKPWHESRGYPLIGLGFSYMNYNMPDIYGSVIGVNPNITLYIIKRPLWEWTVRAGMGVGYVTNAHNTKTGNNHQNVSIGGAWNNVSPFAMDIRYKPNNQWQVQAGVNFMHVSNAAFQQPNLGINTYGYHIGARYFPTTSQPEKVVYSTAPPQRNNFMLTARTGIAFKEKGPADGPTYRVYIGQLGVAKKYAGKNKVSTGIDVHYHTNNYYFTVASGAPVKSKFRTAGEVAWYLGHEFMIGRVGVIGQLGYYVLRSDSDFGKFRLYQKVGGSYYFLKQDYGFVKEVYFTALLKTHLSVAELFEMGIGINF